jgi:hypothetical protein
VRGVTSRRLTIWAALFGLFAATYVFRLDAVCGLSAGDAWYVLLAQAIATGRGYTLINAPSPGIVPAYPPGFPILLPLVFWIASRLPENVPLLKAVSIASMAG